MSPVGLSPLSGLFFFCTELHPACFGAVLEKEVTRAAEASDVVRAVLEAKIGEHDAL